MATETELRKKLNEDPGSHFFVELANILKNSNRYDEAILICMKGLEANNKNHEGRLLLAQLLYEKELFSFSVRELNELRKDHPESKYLKKLIEKLSLEELEDVEYLDDDSTEETIAEIEFSDEDLDALLEDD